jgi:hypothetical protein
MGQVNTCDKCGKVCGDKEAFVIPESRRGKSGCEVLCQSPDGKEEGCLFDYLRMYKPKVDALNVEFRDKDNIIAINTLIDFMKPDKKGGDNNGKKKEK